MADLLQVALDALRELAHNPAFEDDAPEFNEGGIGHEACRLLSEELAKEADEMNLPELTLQDEREYLLGEGHGVWVRIGFGSLRLKHSADGVIATLYKSHHEDEDEVGEICAFWGDLMPDEICEGCLRESFTCSLNPCEDVQRERNE